MNRLSAIAPTVTADQTNIEGAINISAITACFSGEVVALMCIPGMSLTLL